MDQEELMEDPQVLHQQKVQKQMDDALNNPELPRLYCNGFIVSIGTGDLFLALKLNETPIAVLNISYTVAKTLAQKVGTAIANLEDRTGNSIMTTEDIAMKLVKDADHD